MRKSNTPSAEDEEKGLEKKEKNADDYSTQTENSALTKVFDDRPETEKSWKESGKKQQHRKTVTGCNKGELSWWKRACFNNIAVGRYCQKTTKTSKESSFLTTELKELLEYVSCMVKNELRNVTFKYQMVVWNRQRQVPTYTEGQDSCQYLMSVIPSQHSHTKTSSPLATPIWAPQYRDNTQWLQRTNMYLADKTVLHIPILEAATKT